MDRAEGLRQLKERANANRDAVEKACPVPVSMRASLGALVPEANGPRMDSSDTTARISIGTASSLDLAALSRASFGEEASWFDVACVVLSDFPPQLEESSRVWISDMGSLYHRYDDCQIMWEGKRTAHEEGMKVHGVHSRTLREAIEGKSGFGHKLKPCKTCI